MTANDESAGRAIGSRHLALLVFALMVVLFSLIDGTRPIAIGLLWIVAPVAAFGTLVQVIRGSVSLRSGRGLIFSMWCAAVATIAIPLGALVVDPDIGSALTFLGFLSALIAAGFARLSVTAPIVVSRELPPEQEFVTEDGQPVPRSTDNPADRDDDEVNSGVVGGEQREHTE
ncbi:hypothetical protein Halru_1474 [Halovivax ruber XH-70]|uniref:Uncharacterized protein n=1 Tax=Halovivax ruber (strain DSM 18193 / JCM 13892 / XH-70) TaxID=797302 RepID=L0IDN3_HALRX|nr:hypothetical protein [Halovivax ruber]AGB16082.1 hypothetical protein Halru_1474 [Halovivax ruber XH-70]